MKKFYLSKSRFGIVGLLSCALIASAAISRGEETSSGLVTVKLKHDTAPLAISRLLFGAQYNYFSSPVRERLRDDYLLNSWREMPVTVLRYPGGTWGDHYLWDNPEGSYYVAGNAKSVISPEQFVENCRAIGAEPIFQVNTHVLGKGGHSINPGKLEDIQAGAACAARWVFEANKLKKWNIKYWEIGNEVWIWLKPQEYAKYVVEYSKAMKAVDPTIKIIACGLVHKVGPFKLPWLKFPDDPSWSRPEMSNDPDEWNQALLDGAIGHFDYIAPHIYIETGNEKLTAKDRFIKTNALIHVGKSLGVQADWKKKMGLGVKIAITEWSCNHQQSVPVLKSVVPLTEQYYYSLGNGLNVGFMFGKILESNSEIAILHNLDDFQTLWYWPKKKMAEKGPLLHPVYYAMKIWGHHLGKTPLAVEMADAPKISSEISDFPAIYTYASEDERNIYVVAINLDPDAPHEVSVVLPAGLSGKPAELTWLKGKEIDSQNFAAWNGNAPEEVSLTEESVTLMESRLSLKMPPHSMVGVTISKILK